MTTSNIPSMNAMVDSITDAVETAIIRGNHSGGVRRFMVQGAVRRALRDIHFNGSTGFRPDAPPATASVARRHCRLPQALSSSPDALQQHHHHHHWRRCRSPEPRGRRHHHQRL
ncbi:unnamed protein product [Urochloa humidicola]